MKSDIDNLRKEALVAEMTMNAARQRVIENSDPNRITELMDEHYVAMEKYQDAYRTWFAYDRFWGPMPTHRETLNPPPADEEPYMEPVSPEAYSIDWPPAGLVVEGFTVDYQI